MESKYLAELKKIKEMQEYVKSIQEKVTVLQAQILETRDEMKNYYRVSDFNV